MARKDKPYLPLYVQDFMTDEKLMECSASATGVYIRIMCVMHKSEPYGTVLLKQKDKQNAKQNAKQNEIFASKLARHLPYDFTTILGGLDELLAEGCLQIEGDSLVQKRMFDDGNLSETRSESGTLGGITTQENTKNFAQAKPQAKPQAKVVANADIDNDTENDIENVIGIKKKESMSGVKRVLPKKEINDPFNGELIKWKDWKIYKRKEHRFSYKSSESENQALKNLHELCNGDISIAEKIIEQSIGNGWQGLFKLKNTNNGQPTNQQRPTKSSGAEKLIDSLRKDIDAGRK